MSFNDIQAYKPRLVRPCPIDKELYHKFSDKCRNNDEGVGDALDALMGLYLEDKLKLPTLSKRKINRIARPTFVTSKIYIEFGNKCRLNGIRTADTLERVIKRYIKNRDNLPLIIKKIRRLTRTPCSVQDHMERKKEILKNHKKQPYLIKELKQKNTRKKEIETSKENHRVQYVLDEKIRMNREKRKECIRKINIKRRNNFKDIFLFYNPFPNEFDVDYHHIHNWFTMPLPWITHRKNIGKNHREKCQYWIEKIYLFDFDELLSKCTK